MAFTRKALKDIGVTEEQLDKIMALHGTSLADYQLKSEFKDAVKAEVDKQTGEIKKKYEGIDIEDLKTKAESVEGIDLKSLQEQAKQAETLQKELATLKTTHAAEQYVDKMKPKDAFSRKAIINELLSQNFEIENDTFKGADEWANKFKEENASHFAIDDQGNKKPAVFSGKAGNNSGQEIDPAVSAFRKGAGLKNNE